MSVWARPWSARGTQTVARRPKAKPKTRCCGYGRSAHTPDSGRAACAPDTSTASLAALVTAVMPKQTCIRPVATGPGLECRLGLCDSYRVFTASSLVRVIVNRTATLRHKEHVMSATRNIGRPSETAVIIALRATRAGSARGRLRHARPIPRDRRFIRWPLPRPMHPFVPRSAGHAPRATS